MDHSCPESLLPRYQHIRRQSEAICAPLSAEDHVVQGMVETSPPKWHLAHVSWFFETFLLKPFLPGYRVFHEQYDHLFNSYYETVGSPFPRPHRGLLSRPGVEEVLRYRRHVDEHMQQLLRSNDHPQAARITFLTDTGLNHEQQHQELLYTDIKYNFSLNPLHPVYSDDFREAAQVPSVQTGWSEFSGGLVRIGVDPGGFCYDNETPAHDYYLQDYTLADRPVSNGEYLEFIEDGAYRRVELWLSDAWTMLRREGWQAPLYWRREAGQWWQFTLNGVQAVREQDPVCHISYYEADAFARWAGARLPTEQEWEAAAGGREISGNFADSGLLRPVAATAGTPGQLFGDVWEWTSSPYGPWPGFVPHQGSLGEYNGKFMASQMVLRGGSCLTPAGHVRPSYRNFFYPHERWQMSGLRLARFL